MAKKKTLYLCSGCGYQSPKWLGRCPECGEWNTFEEEVQLNKPVNTRVKAEGGVSGKASKPKTVHEIELKKETRIPTTIKEFDRVVGGGLIPGSLTLIGGQPGIGKSTILIEVMGRLAKEHPEETILYVSGEESEGQVADRAKRVGIDSKNLLIYHESVWQNVLEQLNKLKPKFFVLDSIQTTISAEIQSAPGTVSQIREVTYELMNHVKSKGVTSFIIGHITKDGTIAGPKILEHMVDTVIYFEGDQFGHYRLLRANKNRFGNTNEVGIFEMGETGLREVSNPSQYFLDDHLSENFGRSLTCILEGTRCLFVEVQGLVVENKMGNGRRTTQGVENNRLSMMVAVVEKYLGVAMSYNDIYLNIVGGIKLQARDSDLSIIASLISSYKGKPIDSQTVFIGEVGLTGEVRSVPFMEKRLKEIEQLQYKRVITSFKAAKEFSGKYDVKIIGIKEARELDDLIK